jgi:sugar diacid utilization regulator
MSAQVFSLEQISKERAGRHLPRDIRTQQKLPMREATAIPTIETHDRFHDTLRHLVTALTFSPSLHDLLQALTSLMTQTLGVDLCVVLLQEQDNLHVATCTPDLSDKGIILQPVQVNAALWKQMRVALQRGQMPQLSEHELRQLNPLQNVQYQTLLPIPLIAGNTCLGLLLCYSSKIWHSNSDDELMLCTIAAQAALAIQHRQCVEENQQEQKGLVRAFVHDLCEGNTDNEDLLRRRAYFLGFDLATPHIVALIELIYGNGGPRQHEDGLLSAQHSSTEHKEMPSIEERLSLSEDIFNQVRRLLQEQFPGSLVDERTDLLVCLIPVDGEQSAEQVYAWCHDLVMQMQDEPQTHLAYSASFYIGIGNLCQNVHEYSRGYAEARESLEVGRDIHCEGGCSPFNMLGAYRYLHTFAHTDTLRDRYQEQIATIVAYDRRKKTNLLDTLEVYLECGGNIARTSHYLDVHRNTLLQRLDRIQKLGALDLEHLQMRFPLLVALKVHRLRTHHIR